ncbi:hypothetical protein DPMN_038389 [Dreissena polymorpha]|uniref:Uncharacterized protein n=1 Tax=Dreissena polymorpha TaxID=45954 RepID=A0A9D4MGV8_DREPO|nr:hypothetical protein DPMN_038389 [Dreissena polymorpha]
MSYFINYTFNHINYCSNNQINYYANSHCTYNAINLIKNYACKFTTNKNDNVYNCKNN